VTYRPQPTVFVSLARIRKNNRPRPTAAQRRAALPIEIGPDIFRGDRHEA